MSRVGYFSLPGCPAIPTIHHETAAHARPAIVAAMRDEARTLLPRGTQVAGGMRAETCGVGPERAAHAGKLVLARGATALLSWGTAGALDAASRPGELMIYRAVRWRDGAELACDAAWVESLAERLAPLSPRVVMGLSSPRPVSTAQERRALHEATGAIVVDMESAALAAVAAEAGVPFAVVRCVVDPADFVLPRAALAGIAPEGFARPGRTLAALVRRPYELRDLLRLAAWYRLALARLSAAARCLQPDFACRPVHSPR